MLFQNVCTNPQNYVRKTSENGSKMAPKWSQHLSKIDPGGPLEATWEPPLKQGASKTSFLTILAPFWDPLWDQFGLILGHHAFDVFFEMAFCKPWPPFWAPKRPPKLNPRGVHKQNPEIDDFALFTTLWPHTRVLKIVYFGTFLDPSLGAHFAGFG